jgi:hypothetical protein
MRVKRAPSLQLPFWAALSVSLFGCNGLSGASDVSIDGTLSPTGGSDAGANGAHAALPTTTLNCAYAPTDPGVTEGKQMPSSLSWQGYVAGNDAVVTLNATDLYDCDGSKGVDVVVYEMAKFFCGSCEQDAATVEGRLAAWRAKGYGVEWVTTLVTGTDGQSPANVEAAKVWRDKHAFSTVHVMADPGYKLLPPGKSSFGTPSYVIVDPRTQSVVAWMEGLGGQDPVIEATAAKNSALP